jgi:hypothetical protein
MSKSGVCLSIVTIAGLFCLGGPCRAENISEKAAKDRLIETANGKTIRLVGGFVN